MTDIRDPDDMTPDERLQALAAILARGILRHIEQRKERTERHSSSKDIPCPP